MVEQASSGLAAVRDRGRQGQRTSRLKKWLVDWSMALPLLVLTSFMLVAPMVAMLIASFSSKGQFSLANWAGTLNSSSSQRAISNSLLLGLAVATIALLVGGPLSWLISRMLRFGRAFNLGMLNVAANFSGIGLGFAFIAALGTYGMVTLVIQQFGVPFTPVSQSSFLGMVISYEYSNIPLFVLLSLPAMSLLREEWWEAAQAASATRWQFWRHVGLPILAPFLIADWLLIFTWAVGMYGLPLALVGTSPRAFRLITVEMGQSMVGSFFGVNKVPVYAMILMVIAAVTLSAYRLVIRRAVKWL
jgi:putative spermidine/putrescine transport system permease protein